MSGWIDRPRGLFAHGEWIVILALVVVGAFQVFVLGRNGRSPERLPQLVRGDDALSVAFGGAKETISLAMVHKADSYFHGGVDMECTLDHDHDEDCDHDHHEGCDHDHHSPNPGTQTPQHPNTSFPDPWAWINRHIRAPEVERHLEGEKAVELMPWLWASVRANPHNIDAWTTAWYTANKMIKDSKLALRIATDGLEKNPDSLELLLCLGRTYYNQGQGDLEAAKLYFGLVKERALERCGNNPADLSEADSWMYKFALNYLSAIETRSAR